MVKGLEGFRVIYIVDHRPPDLFSFHLMVFGSFGLRLRLDFFWFLLKMLFIQIGPFYRCRVLLVEADHKSLYFGFKVSDSLSI